MQKGFSLFTPLVGTAIVIMAIVASVTMMQSDARISRGLAKSYEISSQEIVAKLIKATAEMQILTNLKSDTLRDLSTGYTLTCDFNDADICSSKAENAMLNSLLSIKVNLFRGLSEAFENIICIGCSVIIDESQMSNTIRNLPALVVKFDNGYLKETIHSDALSYYEDVFSVTFIDVRGNSIQIPIVPHDFSYTTDDEIEDLIQATADSFIELKKIAPSAFNYENTVADEIKNAMDFNPCAGFGKIEEIKTSVYYQGQGGLISNIENSAFEITWKIENVNTLNLKMCDPQCEPIQMGYLVKQLTCSCLSGNLECQSV